MSFKLLGDKIDQDFFEKRRWFATKPFNLNSEFTGKSEKLQCEFDEALGKVNSILSDQEASQICL